jgi:Na+/phosphate symporter
LLKVLALFLAAFLAWVSALVLAAAFYRLAYHSLGLYDSENAIPTLLPA